MKFTLIAAFAIALASASDISKTHHKKSGIAHEKFDKVDERDYNEEQVPEDLPKETPAATSHVQRMPFDTVKSAAGMKFLKFHGKDKKQQNEGLRKLVY